MSPDPSLLLDRLRDLNPLPIGLEDAVPGLKDPTQRRSLAADTGIWLAGITLGYLLLGVDAHWITVVLVVPVALALQVAVLTLFQVPETSWVDPPDDETEALAVAVSVGVVAFLVLVRLVQLVAGLSQGIPVLTGLTAFPLMLGARRLVRLHEGSLPEDPTPRSDPTPDRPDHPERRSATRPVSVREAAGLFRRYAVPAAVAFLVPLLIAVSALAATETLYTTEASIIPTRNDHLVATYLGSGRHAEQVSQRLDVRGINGPKGEPFPPEQLDARASVDLETTAFLDGDRRRRITLSLGWPDPAGSAILANAYIRELEDSRSTLETLAKERAWPQVLDEADGNATEAGRLLELRYRNATFFETSDWAQADQHEVHPDRRGYLLAGLTWGAVLGLATPLAADRASEVWSTSSQGRSRDPRSEEP